MGAFRCPVNPSHKAMRRRTGPLHHFVKHNDRSQQIIWGLQITMRKSAVEALAHQGFTGFRTNPAQVTFCDGETSNDYLEFIVTGWAVWPFAGHRFCTERAADWLKSSGLRSFSIVNPFEREKRKRYVMDGGFPGGRLSEALPEDLAIKYGSPLGLE
jgi:hypothetical protein